MRARSSTLVLTNVTKLVGLGIAINEMVLRTDARNSVIAFCAVCVLGAQFAENVVLKFIDRLFEGGEARGTVIGARPRSYYEQAWAEWLP